MKKIKISLIFISIITLFICCEKEVEQPDCELNNYGTITISNNYSNPYDIYIDSVFSTTINGKSVSNKIEIEQGNNRKLEARQVSGFLFFPTIINKEYTIIKCNDYTWQIP